MAELLSAELIMSLAPPGGTASIAKDLLLLPEQRRESIRRLVRVPINTADFPILISDMTTVSFLLLAGNRAFSYRVGLVTDQLRSCRKFAVETPDKVAIPAVFITTTVAEVEIELIAVGD